MSEPTRNKIYCGIGSRDTPLEAQALMYQIASELGEMGFMLRSGGAPGADSAFEKGALSIKAPMNIYLPWNFFEGKQQDGVRYIVPSWDHDIETIAKNAHPNWNALRDGSRKMMCRNVNQLLGQKGDKPSDFIVCWTKHGEITGGTGQALRLATFLEIPVFNLAKEGDLERLAEHLSGY